MRVLWSLLSVLALSGCGGAHTPLSPETVEDSKTDQVAVTAAPTAAPTVAPELSAAPIQNPSRPWSACVDPAGRLHHRNATSDSQLVTICTYDLSSGTLIGGRSGSVPPKEHEALEPIMPGCWLTTRVRVFGLMSTTPGVPRTCPVNPGSIGWITTYKDVAWPNEWYDSYRCIPIRTESLDMPPTCGATP